MRYTTLNDTVDDVDSIMETIAAKHPGQKPILVGHSAGGGVVQKYIERFPDRAAGAVLLASFPPKGGSGLLRKWFSINPLYFFKSIFFLSPIMMLWPEKQYKKMMFSSSTDLEVVKKYLVGLNRQESMVLLWQLGRKGWMDSKRVKVPVMVIGGGEDRLITPEMVADTAREYGTDPIMFMEGGHNLFMEPQNVHGVVEAIDRWIQATLGLKE